MTLSEELYFEITAEGKKSDLKQFVAFLKSGDLDDFFEIADDYIVYDDDYAEAGEEDNCSLVFTNDDLGIEISTFHPEDFLDVFCRAGVRLDLRGHFYDIDDEEYRFVSTEGDAGFSDAGRIDRFNDELDDEAYNEEREERENDRY